MLQSLNVWKRLFSNVLRRLIFLFKKNPVLTAAGFRRSFRLSRKDKKTNKSMYECKKSDQYDTADIPTYEEVAKYRRQPNDKYRLVVLVGKLFSLFFFFFFTWYNRDLLISTMLTRKSDLDWKGSQEFTWSSLPLSKINTRFPAHCSWQQLWEPVFPSCLLCLTSHLSKEVASIFSVSVRRVVMGLPEDISSPS